MSDKEVEREGHSQRRWKIYEGQWGTGERRLKGESEKGNEVKEVCPLLNFATELHGMTEKREGKCWLLYEGQNATLQKQFVNLSCRR